MAREPITITSFDQWVSYVFDHPVSKPEWHWDTDAYWYAEKHPAQVIEYMTSLFEDSTEPLARFSDEQLNQGFWFLACPDCSSHMFTLLDDAVPLEYRVRCIRAMVQLFKGCFAKRCSPHVCHGEYGYNPHINALNSACYMWFDLIPIHGVPNMPERYAVHGEFLEAIENILYIPHDACREAGLHGMGEWCHRYHRHVRTAVLRFLRRTPGLRPELVEYALNASAGHVQ